MEEAESYIVQAKKLVQSKTKNEKERLEKEKLLNETKTKFLSALPLLNNSLANDLSNLQGVNHILDLLQVINTCKFFKKK